MDARLVTALTVAGGLGVLGLLLVLTSAGELMGRRRAKVPVGYRPAPGDEELERSTLPKILAWSSILSIFMALWLPLYWLREPTRLAEKKDRFKEVAINENSSGNVGGKQLYVEFCSRCHGKTGEGTLTDFALDGKKVKYAEPPLRWIYERYKKAGRSEEEITQLLFDAIYRGRPGTPMPTWSLQFGGPFVSQQIDNIVLYLQSIQEPIEAGADHPAFRIPKGDASDGKAIYDANCAACHNASGQPEDVATAGSGLIGPNLRVAFQRLNAKQIFDTIQKGRLNTNRPSMPAWAALGEDAIRALVNFIRTIQDAPTGGSSR